MSKKEREQLIVFEKLKNKEITQVEAASRLNVSTRWVRKKFKRYLKQGDVGLVHQNKNRASTRCWNETERALALELIKTEWHGFGPTFAAEKLKELKNIEVSKETLRKAMIKAGFWQPRSSRNKQHRSQRERRPMLGLLVQLDGSPHDWFEGRAPKCTLLVFIDDATSKILWLEFVKSESHMDVMRATQNYINRHGRPHAFYVDFGCVFSVNTNNDERDKKTQWERALEELGIRVHHAHSPQAKGRVERANSSMQDRLVKEMRLAGISSMEEANKYVRESNFLSSYNERYSVPAAQAGDGHRSANFYDLETIFCIKEERVLSNDYTLTFNKRILQLERQQPTIIRPKDVITVCTQLDGSIRLSIRKMDLLFKEIQVNPRKVVKERMIKPSIPYKRSENSRRWAGGLGPLP